MPINQLYYTLQKAIMELRPGQRITQVRAFVWLMVGIYLSRSVQLSHIAGKIPGQAKRTSVTRRLSRLVANPAIWVREWYAPIARAWLAAQVHHVGEVRLIVDSTTVGFGHRLLIVCLAYRRRAIPLAWTWVKHTRGHSPATQQCALLDYVRRLLPPDAKVVLVGDAEFGAVALLRQLHAWGWYYVIRQRGVTWVGTDARPKGQALRAYASRPGRSVWLIHAYLTRAHRYPTHLLVYWESGKRAPWYLATNLADPQQALAYYRRRMWIEEMFGDFKRHGFDLERTMLRHVQRLSRLTLAVVLLYVWLIVLGERVIRKGWRALVDRADRRDLSIFQIGLRFTERQRVNALPIRVQCFPTCAIKLSGG